MLLACGLPIAAPAQDFMGMVEAYGQAHRNLLGDQILANATRQTIRNQQGGASRQTAWPDGIDERTVTQRVLTIEELHAMRYSDLQRMRRLLNGREITVQGAARLHPRAPNSFDIAIPGADGYRVWAYWRNSAPRMPQPGDIVRLRGRAEMERPNSLYLYSPQLLPPVATVRPAPTATPASVTAAADPRMLRFTPSAEITHETNARLVQTLSPAMAQGRSPDEFRRVLDGGELQRGFRQVIGRFGLSDRDLADVMTGHLIMSWQVVNDVPELNEPRGNTIVRDGLREALLQADWMQGLDDARKQALAETLIVGTMLNVSRFTAGKQTGDAQLVSAARQDADAMVRSMAGIDLRQLRFTSRGFERK
ncbi:MAG: hypothetical protein H7A18_07660 [Sinobacteraceae bacterium]|nr:hypothetical protein [Nevskiaceae bacterium]